MNPKEKAKELIEKFYKHSRVRSSGFLVSNEDLCIHHASECALICVEEMIDVLDNEGYDDDDYKMIYLLEIKKEINSFKQ